MEGLYFNWGLPGWLRRTNLPANAGDERDAGSIPGLGRSPGGGNGNPLQHSCLENPKDRGAWRIPWAEEPGRLQYIGSQRVRHNWVTKHALLLLLLLLLSHFRTPKIAAHQAPPSLGFSRQEHWSGLPFPPPMHESEKWKWSHSVMSDSSQPHGLQPTTLLRPWDFPGDRSMHYFNQISYTYLLWQKISQYY